MRLDWAISRDGKMTERIYDLLRPTGREPPRITNFQDLQAWGPTLTHSHMHSVLLSQTVQVHVMPHIPTCRQDRLPHKEYCLFCRGNEEHKDTKGCHVGQLWYDHSVHHTTFLWMKPNMSSRTSCNMMKHWTTEPYSLLTEWQNFGGVSKVHLLRYDWIFYELQEGVALGFLVSATAANQY